MPELIERLKAEHEKIIETLLRGKVLARKKEGRQWLIATKDMFLAHLKHEDEELYPVLLQLSKQDEELKNKIPEIINEMKHISESAQRFFEKYLAHVEEKPSEGLFSRLKAKFSKSDEHFNSDFYEDLNNLYSLILERIQKEEKILYPLYAGKEKSKELHEETFRD